MRLFLSVKYHPDHRNRPHVEAVLAALEAAGHACTCIVRDLEAWGQASYSPAELMRRTFTVIDGCEALAVELSEKGVGVGLEAGYAHARGLPVYTLLPAGADLSTTLEGLSAQVVRYRSEAELTAAARAWSRVPTS
jgi:hypothetical protein